jgi:hypothetical protein
VDWVEWVARPSPSELGRCRFHIVPVSSAFQKNDQNGTILSIFI